MMTHTFNKSADLYNMILGGLIALSSEQQVGKLTSKPASENVFLGKWLKRAKKQRCYPKSVSDDINNLLKLYFLEGRTGNLASLFRSIFRECQFIKGISQQFTQPDKQRFDSAMNNLAKNDWFITLPIKHCKEADAPYKPRKTKEIFTTKWYWDGTFNEQNKLIKSFSIFVVSFPQEVIDCLYEHGFALVMGLTSHDNEGNDYYQYQIFPNNNYYGDVAIPSKFQR
ncbi:MAG: hypothetical protein COB45_11455 [Gammaproteobacteria bacterium]|nr:MAG: hypothetical protein COB45_11455 [Gammaproteobacteria bacterium]PHR83682.1 MAG: hypothetical protein COA59_11360 [Colwellia sp.]